MFVLVLAEQTQDFVLSHRSKVGMACERAEL
jgi:hypothetical protein